MQNSEGIDLVKMAIIVLLVVLVLGTVIYMVFKYNDYTNNIIKNIEDSVKSSKMERLYELQDLSDSNSDQNPLCTAAASVLSEFDETDLLYIAVKHYNVLDGNIHTEIYTYDNIQFIQSLSNSHIYRSSSPTSHAHRFLLQFSDKRCEVAVVEADAISGVKTKSDGKMLAIVITVLN